MNQVELFINEPINAKLDLGSDISVALQYSISNIKDITKRNSNYSKTIELPGTKNNNYWFGNLFDINSDFTLFNPNKKTPAKLLVNSNIVIEGFLQLKNINKLGDVDVEGNKISYEVVIFSNQVDLMSNLGEKTLADLDFSEFNHIYDMDHVENSWQHTYKDGYVYPMYGLDSSKGYYTIENFYPAAFYRTVVDRIIKQAGYSWEGSLEDNDQFNNEIIPFVGDGLPKLNKGQIYLKKFRASKGSITNNLNVYPESISIVEWEPKNQIDFDDDSTDPNFDADDNWDTVVSYWNVKTYGKYNLNINLDTTIELLNNTADIAYAYDQWGFYNLTEFQFKLHIERSSDGGSSWNEIDVHNYNGVNPPKQLSSGEIWYKDININYTTDRLTLYAGDLVRVSYSLFKTNSASYYKYDGFVDTSVPSEIKAQIEFTKSIIRNEVFTDDFTLNDYVQWELFMSDKIKQKDLITDLIKRYNLYIQLHPENPKRLVLKPRDEFYTNDKLLDWSEKKDYSTEDTIEILSELQWRNILFTYKEDNDDFNEIYKEETNDNYGQFIYTFDNDFVQDEKKIESPFSPSPMVKTEFGAIVPALDPSKPKVKPRILYWGGLRPLENGNYWRITAGSNAYSFSNYPYAGHFDDPINPSLDINFGSCKYYFYSDWNYITYNNLYHRYWYNYVDQVKEGRLVTAYFKLNENDISYVKNNLDAKIWVKDSYYYINKIIDYKPMRDGTTKVELLKIRDGIEYTDHTPNNDIGVQGCNDGIWLKKVGDVWVYKNPDGTNVSQECCNNLKGIYDPDRLTCTKTLVLNEPKEVSRSDFNSNKEEIEQRIRNIIIGERNSSGGSNSNDFEGEPVSQLNRRIIIGDDNISFSDKSFIIGSNNKALNDNITIIGGDNNEIKRPNTTLIGSEGLVDPEPEKIYIGNEFKIDKRSSKINYKSENYDFESMYWVSFNNTGTINTGWNDIYWEGKRSDGRVSFYNEDDPGEDRSMITLNGYNDEIIVSISAICIYTDPSLATAKTAVRLMYSQDQGATWNETAGIKTADNREYQENDISNLSVCSAFKTGGDVWFKLQFYTNDTNLQLNDDTIFDNPVNISMTMFNSGANKAL